MTSLKGHIAWKSPKSEPSICLHVSMSLKGFTFTHKFKSLFESFNPVRLSVIDVDVWFNKIVVCFVHLDK